MAQRDYSDEPNITTETGQSGAPPSREIPHDLFCQECGYNLRGLISDLCPECGHSVENVRAVEPQIPWVHRTKLGPERAYWKTIWLVMFRQRRFCEEIARPVSYRDAQSFRWLTILHAYVPIVAVTIALDALWLPWADGDALSTAAFAAVWPVVGFHLLILLYLAAITGLPSYFFHPKGVSVRLQNRAIAMSYYACGPLALTAIPATAMIAMLFIRGPRYALDAVVLFFIIFLPASLGVWLLDLMHISRRVMPQHRWRPALVAIGVPSIWLLLWVLMFVGIPACVFLIAVALAGRN